jgi:serine protease Do
MVNLQGQVVGINSAIASTTGVYQGYGFAIPINLARRIMEDLVEYGTVRRPRIGVTIQSVEAEDAEFYGLPSVSGVLVQTVDDAGPSSGALQREDVIVSLDGEPVGYVAELQAKIAAHRPGDRVDLTVYRERRPVEVSVRLGEAPLNETPVVTAARTVHSEERLGINVEQLEPDVARQIGFDRAGGVILTDVARGSAAERRGVLAYRNNKLMRINDTEVQTAEDVRAALDVVEGGQIVSLHFLHPDPAVGERVVNVRMPR